MTRLKVFVSSNIKFLNIDMRKLSALATEYYTASLGLGMRVQRRTDTFFAL